MTLKEARELRDEIRACKIKATVPMGWGPQQYFVAARDYQGEQRFNSRAEWSAYKASERKKFVDFAERHGIIAQRSRSPIEAMIDKACGIG